MPENAATTLERLTLTPRPGRAVARVRLGVEKVDEHLGGGLEKGALHEVRAAQARDLGAAAGLVLSLIAALPRGDGPARVLWIMDPAAAPDAGFLFPDGVAQYGVDPDGLTLVRPMDVKTALWAAEEGAKCPDLAAVILHVHGNPRRLDRVATRRLLMRARDSGVLVCLLRQSGEEEANAALTRWRVVPRPSRLDADFPRGIGLPRLRLTLERSRSGQTGTWTLSWNPKTRRYDHVPDHADPVPVPGTAASVHRPDRARPLGKVVDFGRAARGAAAGGDRHGAECPTDRGA